MLVFVQPFGLSSPYGGSRILRSLLKDAPVPFLSVCTSAKAPPATHSGKEIHLPFRPYFGRIERSRFGKYISHLNPLFVKRFQQQFEDIVRTSGATGIHAIPHTLDFWYAFQIAQKLDLPYFLSIHDEVSYNLSGKPELSKALNCLGIVWAKAQNCIVISEAMGREYCRRYGERPFIVVTDGLIKVASAPRLRLTKHLHVYFMGAVHLSYKANFYAFLKALDKFQELNSEWQVSFTIRGELPFKLSSSLIQIQILPWSSESEVDKDLEEANFLYLPLPFGAAYDSFSRYSLSTKMVTYLGSGLPILFHGPFDSAAGEILREKEAAIIMDSLDENLILDNLLKGESTVHKLVKNATCLGRNHFWLPDQRKKFWLALVGDTEISNGL